MERSTEAVMPMPPLFSQERIGALRRAGAMLILAALTALVGCGESPSKASVVDLVDPSFTRFEPLGWLGARVQPIAKTVTVEVDGKPSMVGGVVIREFTSGSPLASHGFEVGDAIVRVGEDWIKVDDHMSLDIIEAVERLVSASESTLTFGRWRAGDLVDVDVPITQKALEAGLPVEVERFRDGALAAATRLVTMQRDDGGFESKDPRYEMAVDAWAGLGLLATRDLATNGDSERALERVAKRIDQLGDGASAIPPLGPIFALMFLAERVGPLPNEVVIAGTSASGHASPMPGSAIPMPHLRGSKDLAAMLEQIKAQGGNIDVTTIDGGSATAPPDGALDHASAKRLPPGIIPEETVIAGDASTAPDEPASKRKPAGDGADRLRKALEKHDAKHLERIACLEAWRDRVVELQKEDGGWGASDDSARYALTCYAVIALSMAQRVGVAIPEEPIAKALNAIRPLIDDGKFAAAVARGADRRVEGGRASLVAWMLRSLDAPERDELAETTTSFSDETSKFAIASPSDRLLHVLAAAAQRRGRGLASWQSFYDQFRYFLVASQRPDGAFEAGLSPEPSALETALAGEAFSTAVGAVILSIQSEATPVLIGRAENPYAPRTDSKGERSAR